MSTAGQTEEEEPGILYLSTLLSEGRVGEVEKLSKVKLPGVRGIESYSGYITVNEESCSNLFFWFFPASNLMPEKSPLVIYLNGGPGNSSLIGLFEEIGPLKVELNGKVTTRQHTWTDQFSVIFVDNPVGVGFSFSDQGGECKTTQQVADNLYCFLTQFLQLYPEYQEAELYIGGVSYAGKFVPALAHKLHTEMDVAEPPVNINLRGIFIGGGLCDPGKMLPLYPSFFVTMGLMSERKGKEIKERIEYAKDKHKQLEKYEEAVMDVLESMFLNIERSLGYKQLDNILYTEDYPWCFESYLNTYEVQRALHVKRTQYTMINKRMILQMAEDFFSGVSEELGFLLDNYKVLIYNGNLDMLVNVPMTEAMLSSVPWSGKEDYLAAKKEMWHDGEREVAGYFTKVKDFTRVILRKAGHRASIDQPAWVLDMMSRFFDDRSFET